MGTIRIGRGSLKRLTREEKIALMKLAGMEVHEYGDAKYAGYSNYNCLCEIYPPGSSHVRHKGYGHTKQQALNNCFAAFKNGQFKVQPKGAK